MSDCYSDLFSPVHRPRAERSTFYRNSLGLPTLLESNLGCFQRVLLLTAIVLKSFVATRQLRRFGFTGFRHCEIFPKFCNVAIGSKSRKGRVSKKALSFGTARYIRTSEVFFEHERHPLDVSKHFCVFDKRPEQILKTALFEP